jgi:hypothetical protein
MTLGILMNCLLRRADNIAVEFHRFPLRILEEGGHYFANMKSSPLPEKFIISNISRPEARKFLSFDALV